MAPIIAPDVVRLSIEGTYNGRTWANVFHGVYTGGATAEELATDMQLAWAANLSPAIDSSVTNFTASYVDLGTELGVSGEIPWDGPTSGGYSGASCPPNVAYLLSLKALGTRKQRNGRMYLIGVPEAAVDEAGAVDSTFLDGLTSRCEDFYEDIGLGGHGHLAVLSKATGDDYEGRTVTEVVPSNLVATQRRRLRR